VEKGIGSSVMSKISVRYIVTNVDEAIAFYTEMLGFQVNMHPAPGFASLSRDNLVLLLNQPAAGGAGQTMADGQVPAPGGWNRIQIEMNDLEGAVDRLRNAGCKFRNELVTGRGGKQILLEDPSGNLIELFEPF
jgi:catechol 2,3-dioxygenase-like lactoylglutathione lyase family enzyme